MSVHQSEASIRSWLDDIVVDGPEDARLPQTEQADLLKGDGPKSLDIEDNTNDTGIVETPDRLQTNATPLNESLEYGDPASFQSVSARQQTPPPSPPESVRSVGSFVGRSSSGHVSIASVLAGGLREDIVTDEDALKPDPGTEHDFHVENNVFAFSPGQLSKMFYWPKAKNLAAFHALGGLAGLEMGLRTDRRTGLSVDEVKLDGRVLFEDAVAQRTSLRTQSVEMLQRRLTVATYRPDPSSFIDRKRVFRDAQLPRKKPRSVFRSAWNQYCDGVLIILTISALTIIALGLYRTLGQKKETNSFGWPEGTAIWVTILIVVVLGAVNDWREQRHIIQLAERNGDMDRTVKVIRSARVQVIPVLHLLVGDVVLFEEGDEITADGIFIDGHRVRCDESYVQFHSQFFGAAENLYLPTHWSATGDTDLATKTPADDAYRAIDNRDNVTLVDPFIISGSKIANGRGSFLVTGVGVNCTRGKIVMSLFTEQDQTSLQKKLNILNNSVAKIGVTVAFLLFVVLFIKFMARLKRISANGTSKGLQFLYILTIAVTLVDVAIPSGLPLAVTVALALATGRMLRNNILVRHLKACEALGYTTAICTDDGGPLTTRFMTVATGLFGNMDGFGDLYAHRRPKGDIDGTVSITNESTEMREEKQKATNDVKNQKSISEFVTGAEPSLKSLIKVIIATTTLAVDGETGEGQGFLGSPTESALLTFARDHLGLSSAAEERTNNRIVKFEFFGLPDQGMVAITKLPSGGHRMMVRGSPAAVLAKCTKSLAHPAEASLEPLSNAIKEFEDSDGIYASQPLQTIAFAYKDFDYFHDYLDSPGTELMASDFQLLFSELTLVGFLGLQPFLNAGVSPAVEACHRAGIAVCLVSSNSTTAAKTIAQQCGILLPGMRTIDGPTFRKLPLRELKSMVREIGVLAEATAEDKRHLVSCLQKVGDKVAATGLGQSIHEAGVMKTAAVGIAFSGSTDVTREASDVVILDGHFPSILKAILWGRAVRDSVQKFLEFQLTINFTAVVLTFVSSTISGTEQSVLNSVQLLWVNLIMDMFAILALANDPPSKHQRNQRTDNNGRTPLITFRMWKMILGQATFQLAVSLTLYHIDLGMEARDTIVFNTFVWMQIFNLFNCRRIDNELDIFEGILDNPLFFIVAIVIAGVQCLLIVFGGRALSTVRLSPVQWGVCLGAGACTLLVGAAIRLLPDELIRRCIPPWLMGRKKQPELDITDNLEWNEAIRDLRDELAFLRKIRPGRASNMPFKVPHPREVFFRGSSSAGRRTPRRAVSVTSGFSVVSSGVSSGMRRRHMTRAGSISSAFSAPGVLAGSLMLASPGVKPSYQPNSDD